MRAATPTIAPRSSGSVFAVRWDDGKRVRLAALLVVLLAAALVLALRTAAPADGPGPLTSIIVTKAAGSGDDAERLVEQLGGEVGRHVDLIGAFGADVPAGSLDDVQRSAAVRSAVPDRHVALSSDGGASGPGTSLDIVRRELGMDRLAERGYDGTGVDIAMIDSGVVPAPGLDAPGKVFNGPDLSEEARSDDLRHLDTFGHGTHLAGIMAADGGEDGIRGVAPGARLVNVKVARADGGTSLLQILAAVAWVVENRSEDGLNIRVLNLAFGAPLEGSYVDDPLAFAAEQAWKQGIVVVAASGNGNAANGLDTPAADPYVLAVGASATGPTDSMTDNFVPDWSRRGTEERTPDLLAPGVALVSLRVPGSYVDELYPEARIGDSFFRGNGTSQAAAVVAGAASVLIQRRPQASPDRVKKLLLARARKLAGTDPSTAGAGQLDAGAASEADVEDVAQTWPASTGGFIDGDGKQHKRGGKAAPRPELVGPDGREHPKPKAGKRAASGWSASRWSASRWSASRWSASRWSASRWSASRWSTEFWGE